MLNDRQRIGRYFAQNGRMELTPRQRRRIRHKEFHQSVRAAVQREERSRARKERAAKRAERASFRTSVQAATT